MVPPTRPRAPSMVKARSYSIWSYVALPIPTNTTWRLYGKSRSEKTILKDLLICSHPLLLRLRQKQCFSALAACSSNRSLGVSPAWGRLQCLPHRSTSYLAKTLNNNQTPNTKYSFKYFGPKLFNTRMKSSARNSTAKVMFGQTCVAGEGIGRAGCVVLIQLRSL